MKVLILDDDDKRHRLFHKSAAFADHKLTHATTFMQAKNELLFEGPYDLVMLDYDLNDHQYRSMKTDFEKYTGFELAKVIVEEMPEEKRPMVIVHSWNYYGGKYTTEYLEQNKVWVRRWEFDNEMKNIPLPAGPRLRK